MIDALNSIEARRVHAAAFSGPAAGAGTGGQAGSDTVARRFGRAGLNGAALPGLGDYGLNPAADGASAGIFADARARGPLSDHAARFSGDSRADSRTVAETRTDTAATASRGRDTTQQAGAHGATAGDRLSLSPEAEVQLRELKRRDAEVRAHERAHMAAGGQYVAGGPSYEYQQGPDGRQYAIGGHVSIDASSIPDDPEADLAKARQVRRAALAPGEPSAQDRAVAARAAAQESRAARARSEEKAQNGENGENGDNGENGPDAPEGAESATAANAGPAGLAASAAPEKDSGAAISGAERPNSADSAIPGAPWGHAEPWAASLAAVSGARAAETYADMALRGVMPTTLAPGGTGISLSV